MIELLVVISVIAVLLSILLPALGAARDSATSLQCKANQRSVTTGIIGVIDAFGGRIPATAQSTNTAISTHKYMDLAFPDVEVMHHLDPATPDAFNVCPEIETRYNRPAYAVGVHGYAINTRLREGGTRGDNNGVLYTSIRSPSDYPFFAESRAIFAGSGEVLIGSRFGTSAGSLNDWWLGTYHNNDTTGNVTYADGHTSDYTLEALEEVDYAGIPTWLTDGG